MFLQYVTSNEGRKKDHRITESPVYRNSQRVETCGPKNKSTTSIQILYSLNVLIQLPTIFLMKIAKKDVLKPRNSNLCPP
jgi:hypothetical protein